MTQEVFLPCSCFTSPITRAARFAELAWGDRQAPLLELPTLKEAHLGWLQGMRQGNASLQLFAHLRHPLCSAAVLCLAFPRFQGTTQCTPASKRGPLPSGCRVRAMIGHAGSMGISVQQRSTVFDLAAAGKSGPGGDKTLICQPGVKAKLRHVT